MLHGRDWDMSSVLRIREIRFRLYCRFDNAHCWNASECFDIAVWKKAEISHYYVSKLCMCLDPKRTFASPAYVEDFEFFGSACFCGCLLHAESVREKRSWVC